MFDRKVIDEHDEAWNLFNEIERMESDVENSKHIKSRFTSKKVNALKEAKEKLDRYLTCPATSKANKWRSLIINSYLKKSDAQKENLTLLIFDLMAEASRELEAPFPVEEQEVRRFLASYGIK